MDIKIVIPARYESSRYPGKPLVNIKGKSLLLRVYEKCVSAVGKQNTYVATDDQRISDHCKEHDMNCIMTSSNCLTGTDRVYEAVKQLKCSNIINVQGDEPLITKEDILKIIRETKLNPELVHCGMCDIDDPDDFFSCHVPKIVTDNKNYLLYASRAGIPTNKKHQFIKAKRQVCIYSFPSNALYDFYEYGRKSKNEEIEDIEILRFLDLGHKVKMVEISKNPIAVDTKEDAEMLIKYLEDNNLE